MNSLESQLDLIELKYKDYELSNEYIRQMKSKEIEALIRVEKLKKIYHQKRIDREFMLLSGLTEEEFNLMKQENTLVNKSFE